MSNHFCERCKQENPSRNNTIRLLSTSDDIMFRSGEFSITICRRCEDKLYSLLNTFCLSSKEETNAN